MSSTVADLVVIGGGPAGVSAALRARELGATVALVERGRLGGTCTNDGCVPTRALAKAARLVRDANQFADYGLIGEAPSVDLKALLDRTRAIVDAVHGKKDLRAHLEWAGVQLRAGSGPARFADPGTLTLAGGGTVQGRSFLICAGGHARRLPLPGAELALTHSDVWTLETLPRSLVVVGGAATGCQLASVFAAFGTKVTLLEMGPTLVANEDAAVGRAVTDALAGRGIDIVTGIGGIDRIERGEDGAGRLRLIWKDAEGGLHPVGADQVVMAVGWPGNTEALGLDAAGVEVERGYIRVDDRFRTSAPNIWAAGDITGRMMLVQSATVEARLAADSAIMGDCGDAAQAHTIVPHGGFTDPEYGSVGLTEAAARAAYDDRIAVATVDYADLDRAVVDGHTTGFCKLIVARDSAQLLGAHVVGEQAVEVVQLVAAGMAAGMRVEQLADVELAYPTFTSIVGLCARRLARELGAVPVSPQWRNLGPGLTEWERRG
jgi:pyruvate/2-oxoglutarate dehydrogenase complex dihydrolipoamide dehydrogenase (E3) component